MHGMRFTRWCAMLVQEMHIIDKSPPPPTSSSSIIIANNSSTIRKKTHQCSSSSSQKRIHSPRRRGARRRRWRRSRRQRKTRGGRSWGWGSVSRPATFAAWNSTLRMRYQFITKLFLRVKIPKKKKKKLRRLIEILKRKMLSNIPTRIQRKSPIVEWEQWT